MDGVQCYRFLPLAFFVLMVCRSVHSAVLIDSDNEQNKEVLAKHFATNVTLDTIPDNGTTTGAISSETTHTTAAHHSIISNKSITSKLSKPINRQPTHPRILLKKTLINSRNNNKSIATDDRNITNTIQNMTQTNVTEKPNSTLTSTATSSQHTNSSSKRQKEKDAVLDLIKGLGRKRNSERAMESIQSQGALNSRLDSSIIGSLLIGLLAVVVVVVMFVMLICFMHRWRENMIQSATHPSVLYSMLRQNETDPEDQLGEILVSIGLASESDIRPTSPSLASTPSSGATSPTGHSPERLMIEGAMLEPEHVGPPTPRLADPDCFHPLLMDEGEDSYMDQGWGFDNLSNIPLDEDRLSPHQGQIEESDEELLQ